MLRRTSAVVLGFIFLITPSATLAQQPSPSPSPPAATAPATDPNDPIERIKDEGMNRSQVMQTLSYLSDVIGPRLTNSPGMKRANDWTKDQLTKWGLQNAHLDPWGPFGRGWTLKRFSAQVVEPLTIPLIAYPKAWSPSTALTGEVFYIDAKDEAELLKFKGRLKGAIVLTARMREVKAGFDAAGTRLNEKDLLALADAPEPRAGRSSGRRFQLTPEQTSGRCVRLRQEPVFPRRRCRSIGRCEPHRRRRDGFCAGRVGAPTMR